MAQLDKDIMDSLSGLNGVVYIMFVGAERYASEFREKFVEYGIIRNKENVNQSIERLTRKGDKFLKFLGEKHTGGRPAKIYTANLEPLKQTLAVVLPLGSNFFEDQEVLRILPRFIFEYFPRFISIEKKYFNYDIRYRSWLDLCKTFFNFIVMLGIDFALKKIHLPKILEQNVLRMAPLGLFLLPIKDIRPKLDKGLFREYANLKNEILKNMTESERSFFKRKYTKVF